MCFKRKNYVQRKQHHCWWYIARWFRCVYKKRSQLKLSNHFFFCQFLAENDKCPTKKINGTVYIMKPNYVGDNNCSGSVFEDENGNLKCLADDPDDCFENLLTKKQYFCLNPENTVEESYNYCPACPKEGKICNGTTSGKP